MDTWTSAPVPLELVVTITAPRTVVSLRSGNLARYRHPVGFSETTGASVAQAVAEREARRPKVGFRERIVVVESLWVGRSVCGLRCSVLLPGQE